MRILIAPHLSGFPYAKMRAIADAKDLGAKPVAGKGVAHFDWDGVAQEMECVYRGVTG